MKKISLTLLIVFGMLFGIVYAQNYVVVNQGAKKTGFLMSKVNSIIHEDCGVTIKTDKDNFFDVETVDSITFDAEDGIVRLYENICDYDVAFLTKLFGNFAMKEGCVCTENSRFNAVTYAPPVGMADTICIISTAENNIPTQMITAEGIYYFGYPTDTTFELVYDDGVTAAMVGCIKISMDDLKNCVYGEDAFKSTIANAASLLKDCNGGSVDLGTYANLFETVCELPYVDDEEFIESLPIGESGHYEFSESMSSWYDDHVNMICNTLFMWTGDASYKVGGSSCTLSGSIWCPSNTYNEYGTYGILCDTDPDKLLMGQAEFEATGFQPYDEFSFNIDYRGLKPNTNYYYRVYYKFNNANHGGLVPRYGEITDQVVYDPVIKSFRTGENMLTVDVVMCIDVTGSMYDIINTVKRNAIGFYDAFKECCDNNGIQLTGLNTQVIAFQDKYHDGDRWLQTSSTYWLPDQSAEFKSFVNNLYADDGGDWPESGLDALQVAFNKQDWSVDDGYHRQVVILWTDAPYLINDGYGHYTDVELDDLEAQWNAMSSGRRLILFAPYLTYDYGYTNAGDWGVFDNWTNVIHVDDLSNGFNNFQYILESIIGELTSKAKAATLNHPVNTEFRPNK